VVKRWGYQVALVGSVVLGALAAASAAASAPGDLDATFATAGQTATISGSPEDVAEANGKVYTVSDTNHGQLSSTVHIRAFTSAGVLDAAFSGDGQLDVAVPATVTSAAIAVDPIGRVVVALSVIGDGSGQRIWRFEADGDPDLTFDTDGVQALPVIAGFSSVNGLGFQSDGDLLVGINDAFALGGLSQFPQVVRLTGSGAVAQTVDVVADYTERGALAVMEVDGSGRPYVLVPDDGLLTIRRFTAALAVDTAYSGDGKVSVARPGGSGDNDNWGGALSVSADGVALVAGTVGTYIPGDASDPPVEIERATLVARVSASGGLDPTFSADGIATLARPTGGIWPNAIGRTGSGGAAIAGWRSIDGENLPTGVAWQLTAAGAPETGFSGDGRVERGSQILNGVTSASGTRFYLYEGVSSGQVAAVQLVPPAAATVPAAPAAPTLTGASGSSLNVAFTAPGDGGSPLSSFDLLVYEGSSSTPVQTVEVAAFGGPGSNHQATPTGLTAGALYRFKVRAVNAVGDGALSPYSGFGLPPFRSLDVFVNQQYTDFVGRAPTASELSGLRNRLQAGTVAPSAAIAEVSVKPEWATLDPLTRIYYAYFGRPPDSSGLKYWLGKRRSGTKVSAISNQFVNSNEFKNKYGSLSNRAFVQLVYQNVLGRAGDAAGVNSWTAKLDAKTKTRGDVMVQFSESGEHVRRRAGEVNTVSIVFGMLVRAPSSSELTTWAPQLKTTKVPLIESVLAGSAYDNRIPSA
jgi:hypothetical protein